MDVFVNFVTVFALTSCLCADIFMSQFADPLG